VAKPIDQPIKWTTRKILILLTPSIALGILGVLMVLYPRSNQESWEVILGVLFSLLLYGLE